MRNGDKVIFPTGHGVLMIEDQDTSGVVIVHDERGEYRRVSKCNIKLSHDNIPTLGDADRVVGPTDFTDYIDGLKK